MIGRGLRRTGEQLGFIDRIPEPSLHGGPAKQTLVENTAREQHFMQRHPSRRVGHYPGCFCFEALVSEPTQWPLVGETMGRAKE